jgi:SAM-dependent methyltransferase
MNPGEYARMRELEDWYWWFVARREAALSFLEEYAPKQRPLRVLDAGCGTGALLHDLGRREDTDATGLDASAEALELCSRRGLRRVVRADLAALPFGAASFDAVTALDVLEHLPDDARAAREIARVLRPGGVLVASVPAYPLLWGPHDVALQHHRRYTARALRELLRGAGLFIEYQTFLLGALLPAAATTRLVDRLRAGACPESRLPAVSPAINRALVKLQRAELAFARRVPLPYGLSLLAVARRAVPERVAIPRPEEAVPAPASVLGR